ncbi:MAG: LysM peptidoglycan-binding domain-containing protein [Acidobacteria bacterium]|nr:LysM peptidoglycan-binding domain-containing protein [Acidobacteriota bacterium]
MVLAGVDLRPLRRLLPCLILAALATAKPGLADSPATIGPAAEPPLTILDPKVFPLPSELEPNVRFWTQIFVRYNSHQVVLHDEDYPAVVYAVLDFTRLETENRPDADRRRQREQALRRTEQKYRTVLQNLADGDEPADVAAGNRVRALFAGIPGGPEKYTAAIDRFRTQRGLSDVFEEAIGRSGRYLPAMEETFRARGLPTALSRLAFVESMFQEGARSKVGAGGMWQIMPATGRRYLNVAHEVDERFDPLLAADAAARILEENHAVLGTWPLAVTAYNYGVNGLRRAVERLGTRDTAVIFARHKTRTFGFASRNFYTEFVAAATVYELRQQYFPGVHPAPAIEFDEFVPDRFVSAAELAQGASIELDELKALNPALADEVWSDDLLVPKGYRLRVPDGHGGTFANAYAALPESSKPTRQAGYRYRVRRGDTLSAIAGRYGTSVSAIQRANGLRQPNSIRIGQELLIPGSRPYRSGGRSSASSSSSGSAAAVHVVRQGETLGAIAARYGASVKAIIAANGLPGSGLIVPGQRLQIPAGDRPTRHVVQAGETLAEIAHIYGTTVAAIQQANRIRNHIIHPLQTLIIP